MADRSELFTAFSSRTSELAAVLGTTRPVAVITRVIQRALEAVKCVIMPSPNPRHRITY